MCEDVKNLGDRMIFLDHFYGIHAPHKNQELVETPYIMQSHMTEICVYNMENHSQLV